MDEIVMPKYSRIIELSE